jgi:hypothetical protein
MNTDIRQMLLDNVAKETGKLIMSYAVLITIGVFLGWIWAFILLTFIYLRTLVLLWNVLVKVAELKDKK